MTLLIVRALNVLFYCVVDSLKTLSSLYGS